MRDIKVDTLRGLACIFLVAYHVIGNNPSNGLKIEDGWIRDINDILESVRMPLFTFLSGVVYAYRPLKGAWIPFLRGKVRRLLIPMFVVGTFFAVVQSIVPGTNNSIENWWLLHIYPVQHFWFVEALFFVFILIVPLELTGVLNRKLGFVLIIGSFLFLSLWQPYSSMLAFKGFIYLTPFFLFGVYSVRFGLPEIDKNISIVAFLLMMIGLYLSEYSIYGKGIWGCLIGFISCYLLLKAKLEFAWLASIGVYSYSIYIFHVFFTAATRIGLSKFHFYQVESNLLLAITFGIAGPIIVYEIANKIPSLRLLLLGQRFK